MDPSRFVATGLGRVVRTGGAYGYEAFVPAALPRTLELSIDSILDLSEADDALGRLAGTGRVLPNPHLLVNAYLTQEALSSSRIEGTQASLREVFQAVAGGPAGSADVLEVQNCIRAMNTGLALLDRLPICLRLVRKVHRVLLQGVRGAEHRPGEFRRSQNWIGAPGRGLAEAAFIPPPPEHLDDLLKDWEAYANENPPTPVLVQCALLHYQFETIHPFLDGNGRVGRLLIVLFLVQRSRLPQPLLYVSRFFEEHRSEYYNRLQAVRERGDLEGWIRFFLTAVSVQARDAIGRADRLLDIRERARQTLRGSRSRAAEVVELLVDNPMLTVERVERALGVSKQGATYLIRQLEGSGLIQHLGPTGRGHRYVWVAQEMLDVLQAPGTSTSERQRHGRI